MGVTRLVSLADAVPLAALVRANREFLAPWFPAREDAYFTVEGQRKVLENELGAYAREAVIPRERDHRGRIPVG
jgi:[ribosomal protein S5]-alanine N-acetyltransferase